MVRPQFGGSEVLPHDDETIEVATFLADCSRRGRPWQICGQALFDAGGTLSTRALREVARYDLESAVRPYKRAWQEAQVSVLPSDDRAEWIADVATAAARRMSQAARQVVREEVVAAQPFLSSRELKEAVQTALVWRSADINVPGYMTPVQRNLARHGTPEPPDVIGIGFAALPSERARCIETLTWAEASLARAYREASRPLQPEDPSALTMATWQVTVWRMLETFSRPDRPLTDEQLRDLLDRLEEELEEDSSDGTDPMDEPQNPRKAGDGYKP